MESKHVKWGKGFENRNSGLAKAHEHPTQAVLRSHVDLWTWRCWISTPPLSFKFELGILFHLHLGSCYMWSSFCANFASAGEAGPTMSFQIVTLHYSPTQIPRFIPENVEQLSAV